MENIKKYIIDFIEGRICFKEFIDKFDADDEICDYLDSLAPKGKTIKKWICNEKIVTPIEGRPGETVTTFNTKFETIPFSSRVLLGEIFIVPWSTGKTGQELDFFGKLTKFIQEEFPLDPIKPTTYYHDRFNFILDACPEYLNSCAIEPILDSLIQEFPETMKKTKRIKAFKQKLKEMFYVEGHKYPYWIQESEWPLSKTGKPTKFIRQKSKGEVTYYYFLDVDTGEEIKIMQAY